MSHPLVSLSSPLKISLGKGACSRSPGSFYAVCRWIWLGVFGCTMRMKSRGLEEVTTGGIIVAVSHVGHLDPIVVSALIGRRIGWISRVEFFQSQIMRRILYHGGAFQVDRKGAALPTIREGLRRLARGDAIGIFPEGELMQGERSVLRGARIKHGVCMLAARSGKPVLPVVVLGTDLLGNVGPWLPAKRGRLWVRIGTPIFATENGCTRAGRQELALRLTAEYVRLYAEMRSEFELPDGILP